MRYGECATCGGNMASCDCNKPKQKIEDMLKPDAETIMKMKKVFHIDTVRPIIEAHMASSITLEQLVETMNVMAHNGYDKIEIPEIPRGSLPPCRDCEVQVCPQCDKFNKEGKFNKNCNTCAHTPTGIGACFGCEENNFHNWWPKKTEVYCTCEKPTPNYPEMVWCDNCGKKIKDDKIGINYYCEPCKALSKNQCKCHDKQ